MFFPVLTHRLLQVSGAATLFTLNTNTDQAFSAGFGLREKSKSSLIHPVLHIRTIAKMLQMRYVFIWSPHELILSGGRRIPHLEACAFGFVKKNVSWPSCLI